MQPVKLLIYQKEYEKTYIEDVEARSFEDFILVYGDYSNMDNEQLADLHEKMVETHNKFHPETKPILFIDKSTDIDIYGLKEESEELENES